MNYVDFGRRQVIAVRGGLELTTTQVAEQVDEGMALAEQNLGAVYNQCRKRVVDDLFALSDLLAVWSDGIDDGAVVAARGKIPLRETERLFYRGCDWPVILFDRVRFSLVGPEAVALEAKQFAELAQIRTGPGWAHYLC